MAKPNASTKPEVDDLLEAEPPVQRAEPEPPPEPEPEPKPEPQPEPGEGVEELKAQVEEFRRQAEESKRRQEEAERRVAAASGHAANAEDAARAEALARLDSYDREIKMATDLVKAQLADAKAKQVAAYSEGKYDEVAELGDQIARLGMREEGLAGEVRKIEFAKKHPPRSEREMLDEYIEKQMHPASRDWVKKHPQFMTDRVFRDRVGKFTDHLSTKFGEDFLNTPAYFKAVEQELGLASSEEEEHEPAPAARATPVKKPIARAAPAMPPSTEQPPGTAARRPGGFVERTADGNPILTQDMQRAADAMGMSYVDYANLLDEGAKKGHPALRGRTH